MVHVMIILLYFTVPILITPSGINTAGKQYQLTCAFFGSIDSAPVFLWTGPPNGGLLPSGNSDTRTVSDVMSSGSTHTSILQFDPLQSSHEGNYTCRVVVGAILEIISVLVNVEAPVTSQQPTVTTRPVGSDNTKGATNVAAIVAGLVVGLLVVVILSVMVAVIVMVCIFRRQHSARNK